MRLLIKLLCTESGPYEFQYHYHLQAFIYNLLRDSKYQHLHNKAGYKYFCFSNIFPATRINENDIRTFVISSPDSQFISFLLDSVVTSNYKIKIGRMKFKIDSASKLDVKIPTNLPFCLITGTPIIIRISREKYKEYGIEPSKNYDYLYWRTEHPIELFMSQIKNNLLKKYNEYFGLDDYGWRSNDMNSFPLFQKFKFKKQISTKVVMKNTEQTIIGTLWEFEFEGWENRKLIQFALDTGLGERNSLGFGFMNVRY